MKKIIGLFLLYFLSSTSTLANSVVPLAGGGVVLANSSQSLALTGLTASVTYSVVCYIDTTYPFQYILFGSSLSDIKSVITSYSLNGNLVMQDQLLVGHNTAVINGSFVNPSTDTIIFTNLDQTNPFTVSNCFAVPMPK
jgi:hypothetical protein